VRSHFERPRDIWRSLSGPGPSVFWLGKRGGDATEGGFGDDILQARLHSTSVGQSPAQGHVRGRASSAVEAELLLALVAGRKVGRNAPCPCGSNAKYKKCCGRML
jgi:hypothetical protein